MKISNLGQLLVIALLAMAFPAEAANSFKLQRMLHRGPATPVAATLTVRSTENQVFDASAVSAVNNASVTELISVTYTGPVTFRPWNYPDCGTGNTCTYRRNELVGVQALNLLQSSSASNGTGVGTLTFASSAGTSAYQIDVATPEILTCNYGVKSDIRFGGCPMYKLAGGATDWTTTDPNWEVFNQRLVIKCVPNAGTCPANGAGTFYFTGNASSAIPVASRTGGPVSVVVSSASLGVSKTIVVTWVPHQANAAPTPSWYTNNANNSQICDTLANLNAGEVLRVEGTAANPQSYGSGTFRCSPSTYAITTYAGGPALPTEPYGYGDGTNDQGWITIKGDEPFGVSIPSFQLNFQSVANGPHPSYARLYGINFTAGGGFTLIDLTNSRFSYLQMDHSRFGAYTGGNSTNATLSPNFFYTDNYFSDQLSSYGCDHEFIGNKFENLNADNIHHATWQCTPGGSKAKIAWNYEVGSYVALSTQHIDGAQGVWSTLTSLTSNTQTDGPLSYGNVMVPGPTHLVACADVYVTGCSGTTRTSAWAAPADIGVKYLPSQQCFLEGDIPGFGDTYVSHRQISNLCVTNYVQGLSSSYAAPSGFVRFNTASNAVNITQSTPVTGLGSPLININGNGAQEEVQYNLGAQTVGATALNSFTAPTPLGVANNIASIAGSESTYYQDPTHTGSTSGQSLSLMQTWLDMYTPKAAATVGGVTYGAVGNGKIDIRGRRILDASVLLPDAGALTNQPVCTNGVAFGVAPSHTGTGKVAGDTFSLSVASTFTNSPTIAHNWMIQQVNGSSTAYLNRSSAATYAITGADLALTGTISIFDVDVGTTSGGTGGCTGAAFQIKP